MAMLSTVKYLIKMPYRMARRAGISARLPRVQGRGWRSAVSPMLQVSINHGLVGYRYRDIPMEKHPVDIALYMRLIWETKPRTVVEIGSLKGGSAAWLGDMLHNFGIDGQVLSVDVVPPKPPYQPGNVRFLECDQSHLGRVFTDDVLSSLPRPWLVIEDASHHYQPTLDVLQFFDPHLRSGEYIVIEDGTVTEMGTDARLGGGPSQAVARFILDRGAAYEIDARYCDQYGRNVTGNPNGYLRKR